MSTLLLVIIAILLLLLIVLIGAIVFFALRHFKENIQVEDKVDVKKRVSPFCVDHDGVFASASCAITGESLCDECLTSIDDLKIGKKNIDLYTPYKWSELTMFRNSHSDLEDRIKLVKKNLWENNNMPLIIKGHYKINVESDEIESFTTLICKDLDEKVVKKELSFLKL
ncbi:MAG: hypothetical protein N4A33_11965 [Bacteriovoracaceae bacterium]|jgi:hypothetical protein|nr:hypothetical protein [Bacteriovoracaceae bacterium]